MSSGSTRYAELPGLLEQAPGRRRAERPSHPRRLTRKRLQQKLERLPEVGSRTHGVAMRPSDAARDVLAPESSDPGLAGRNRPLETGAHARGTAYTPWGAFMLFLRSGIYRLVVGRAGALLGSGLPLVAASALTASRSSGVPSPTAPVAVSHTATRPLADAEGRLHLSAVLRDGTRAETEVSPRPGSHMAAADTGRCRARLAGTDQHAVSHRPSRRHRGRVEFSRHPVPGKSLDPAVDHYHRRESWRRT
jgi:hypothetical protein